MSTVYNRRTFGLWPNGCFQDGSNTGFSQYSSYTAESLSVSETGGVSCGAVLTNIYGGGYYNFPVVPVDATKAYQFGASVKTITNNYLGHPGSGHMGIRMYDSAGAIIYSYMNGGYGPTVLTRDANPGDTVIYVADASAWFNGTVGASSYATFFPASHPDYNIPHYYSRFAEQYTTAGCVDIGGGEWSVTLVNTVNDFGYALPAGTPVSNGRGTNSNTYNICGNVAYPEGVWTTFKSAVMTGEGYTGANTQFRAGTKFVSFLNLPNYLYRLETAGNSANYLIDNILMFECPNGQSLPTELFARTSVF